MHLQFFNRDGVIVSFPLYLTTGTGTIAEDILSSSKDMLFVFADVDYPYAVIRNEDGIEESIEEILINEDKINYNPVTLSVIDNKPFAEYFGFIRISVKIFDKANHDSNWMFSKLISVLVKPGQISENINAMASFVYKNFRLLLLNEFEDANIGDLGKKYNQGIEARLRLAQDIASIYENNIGFFRANYRFKTKHRLVVGDFEKMNNVSPATIQYISSHPSYLHLCPKNRGIDIKSKTYLPEKTLYSESYYSGDIYENQVIVAFIKYVATELKNLDEKIKEYECLMPRTNTEMNGYISSSSFIIEVTITDLKQISEQLEKLITKLNSLHTQYLSFFPITEIIIKTPPHPTAVFLSIPQYNLFFSKMHMWFNMNAYSFTRERMMMSYVLVSQLYEIYTLTKILQYFTQQGFEISGIDNFIYHKALPCKNKSSIPNTFSLKNNDCKITIYFQPIIYCDEEENGIELYRSTTISYGCQENGQSIKGSFYSPDFLIKSSIAGVSKYIVCDSKFRNFESILGSLSEYQYKYDYSIDVTNKNAQLVAICLFSGKEIGRNDIFNPKNKTRLDVKQHGRPLLLMPLTEAVLEDLTKRNFDLVFRSIT